MYDEEYMDVVEQGPEGAENFDALEEDLLGVSARLAGVTMNRKLKNPGKPVPTAKRISLMDRMQGKRNRKRTGLLQKHRMKRKREREGTMTLPRRMLPGEMMMQIRKAAKMSRLRKREKGCP